MLESLKTSIINNQNNNYNYEEINEYEYEEDDGYIELDLGNATIFEKDVCLIDRLINYTDILVIEEELDYIDDFKPKFDIIILDKNNPDLNNVASMMYDEINSNEEVDYRIIYYKNKYFRVISPFETDKIKYEDFINFTDNDLIELSNTKVEDNVIYIFELEKTIEDDYYSLNINNPALYYTLELNIYNTELEIIKDLIDELDDRYELYDVLYPGHPYYNYVYSRLYNHPVFKDTIFRLDKLFNLNYEGLYISDHLIDNGLVYKIKNIDDYKKMIKMFNLFYNILKTLK